jgi:hypothetical protein
MKALTRLAMVPVDQLKFSPLLQMRMTLTDEETVQRYKELMDDGVVFPPLKAVKDGETFWVWEGFQRGEAYKRLGAGSVEVEVTEGTFDDAKLLAIGANATHGLTRTAGDSRKALTTLLNDQKLLDRVLARAGNDGGIYRAIMKATGVSNGLVYRVFAEYGLKATRDGKLIKVEPIQHPVAPPGPPPARMVDDRPRAEDIDWDADDDDEDLEPLSARTEPSYVPTPTMVPDGTPTYVRDALSRRPQFDELLKTLTRITGEIAALAHGHGGYYLRKIQVHEEPLIRLVRNRSKDGTVREDWHCPLLMAIARAVGAARIKGKCAGCSGKGGCRVCGDTGLIPEGQEYREDISTQLDLFKDGVS